MAVLHSEPPLPGPVPSYTHINSAESSVPLLPSYPVGQCCLKMRTKGAQSSILTGIGRPTRSNSSVKLLFMRPHTNFKFSHASRKACAGVISPATHHIMSSILMQLEGF